MIDDLHCPHLRRPGEGASWEAGQGGVQRGAPLGQSSADCSFQVHDVAVAVDLHELVDGDAAGFTDTPQVVASEIHQHQMLSTLLRIRQQFGGQLPVLYLGAAPWSRTGDGPGGGHAVLDRHESLRAGADDCEPGQPQQVEVGTGVGQSEGPVYLQRIGVGGHVEAL